jgi:hypothetical protein
VKNVRRTAENWVRKHLVRSRGGMHQVMDNRGTHIKGWRGVQKIRGKGSSLFILLYQKRWGGGDRGVHTRTRGQDFMV